MIRRPTALLALVLSLSACAEFTPATCGGPDDPGAGYELRMPETIAGLRVQPEKKATKKLNTETAPADSYQCKGGGAVYTLRDGKELRAVVQVSRLAPDARLEENEFKSSLVRSITGNIKLPRLVGDVEVYEAVSAGNLQLVTTWFRDRFMVFLTVREGQTAADQPVDIDFEAVLAETAAVKPVQV